MNNQELKPKKIITNLYEHFKDAPKKLKIVCDWDEVIQACEPYATWLATAEEATKRFDLKDRKFSSYFKNFWETSPPLVEYSSHDSKMKEQFDDTNYKERITRQKENKNSPNFYQQAPFLTITDDLLKLIKEDKVEELIFLSSYDKRVFPNGDNRKQRIFDQTFDIINLEHKWKSFRSNFIHLQLIPFDETQGQSKVAWVDEQLRQGNKIDIVIDSNPRIYGNISCLDALKNDNFNETKCSNCIMNDEKGELKPQISELCSKCLRIIPIVCSPYYPAVESQHDHDVLLLKTSVSDLTKENFK